MASGALFIVATPIGNLEDVTYRAVNVLRNADLVAAEDTRRTRILLNAYGVSATLVPYHEHNQKRQGENLIAHLQAGKSVALVSDAGTPGISDPGYHLVNLAIQNDIEVVPVPGVSAIIAALSVSGLPTERFSFEGFLPRKKTARRNVIAQLKNEDRTIICYESPYRILSTLEDFLAVCGERWVVVARELTKIHEDIFRGTISSVLRHLTGERRKGEFTLLVSSARFSGKKLPASDK